MGVAEKIIEGTQDPQDSYAAFPPKAMFKVQTLHRVLGSKGSSPGPWASPSFCCEFLTWYSFLGCLFIFRILLFLRILRTVFDRMSCNLRLSSCLFSQD